MKRTKGFISIYFLLVTSICLLLVWTLLRQVEEEVVAQRQELRYRQLQTMGLSLMSSLLQHENLAEQTTLLEPCVLVPGKEEVTPKLQVSLDAKIPLQAVSVTLQDSKTCLQWEQLLLEPPGGRAHSLYQYEVVGSSISGLATGVQGKTALPGLSQSAYEKYKSMSMPTATDLTSVGLQRRLYVGTQAFTIPAYYVVKGEGVLFTPYDITIGKYAQLTDKLWLISGGRITVEAGARLQEALLFARTDIVLGNACVLQGRLYAGRTITAGSGVRFTPLASVLEPFATSIYCK